jgi:hypothetical protein
MFYLGHTFFLGQDRSLASHCSNNWLSVNPGETLLRFCGVVTSLQSFRLLNVASD